MTLYLDRSENSEEGTFGELKNQKMEIVAYTAEHAYDQGNGDWLPKIPSGTYTCTRSTHRLHSSVSSFETFQVEDVPGHTNILIHTGNWPQKDSDGCILLGEAISNSRAGRMVTNSRHVWQEFMDSCQGLNTFTLVVN